MFLYTKFYCGVLYCIRATNTILLTRRCTRNNFIEFVSSLPSGDKSLLLFSLVSVRIIALYSLLFSDAVNNLAVPRPSNLDVILDRFYKNYFSSYF